MGKRVDRHPVAVEFGDQVRSVRKERGWTQERLAESAGMHWTYVGSIERGERNVSLFNIVKLAKALEVQPGRFFGDEQEYTGAERNGVLE